MQVRQRCANGHHTLIFNANERLPSDYVSTNKTLIDWSIQLQADAGWSFYTITSTLTAVINGVTVYNQTAQRDCDGGSTVTWASGTTEIEHNADGSKTASFSCSYSQPSTSNWTPGNASLSGTITLTTIPRATACPNLSGDIESTYNIALNPASDSFSHSLKVTFGSIKQYVNANGNLQSSEYKFTNKNINFTIPSSFYQQFSKKQGTGTLTLTTYNGSTNIGSKTGTLTANCLESRCRPRISGNAVDVNSTTVALTGNANKIVKGYSNAKLTLTLKAATTSGDTTATISSRSVDGTSFSGTTVTLNKVNKKDFNVTVTNSRGFSTTATISASGSLVNYFNPNMNVNFYRVDQTSSNVKLTYSGAFFNQSFGSVANTLTLKWYWRKSTSSSWTTGGTITPTLSGNNISSATIDCGSSYDYQTNYRFKLEAIDKLSNGNREMDITAGIPNFSFGEDCFQHHTRLYDSSNNEILSVKKIFPVGSIFITVTNTNPGTFIGGTWSSFGAGRVLVGVDTSQTEFNTVQKTGGEKTHKLTINEMPSHNHRFKSWAWGYTRASTTNYTADQSMDHDNFEDNGNHITNTGGGKAHNNLQPYVTVYFWRRTA